MIELTNDSLEQFMHFVETLDDSNKDDNEREEVNGEQETCFFYD